NQERKKNPYLSKKLIKIDDELVRLLKKQSLNLDYIPANNEQIYLRELSNLSTGGDPIDCTNIISKEVKELAIQGLKALPNIPHAGVDIIVDPDDDKKGVIL